MRTPKRRPGFTLVELLVVIAIVGVLAALAVMYFPSFSEKKRANNAATMLQGLLYQAKQKAFRDGAPRGLRLIPDPGNPTQYKEVQFIEVPDDFTGATIQTKVVGGAPDLTTVQITGGINVTDPAGTAFYQVQPGDALEVQGLGLPHRIAGVAFVGGYSELTLASPLAYQLPPTNVPPGTPNYRIMRAPRLSGEETTKLPDSVAIDIKTNADFGNPLPMNGDGSIDILFAPSGKIVTPGVTTDFMALWVRDISYTDPFQGNPWILAVHVRTGLVAGHGPGAPPPGDPYSKVKAGTTED